MDCGNLIIHQIVENFTSILHSFLMPFFCSVSFYVVRLITVCHLVVISHGSTTSVKHFIKYIKASYVFLIKKGLF